MKITSEADYEIQKQFRRGKFSRLLSELGNFAGDEQKQKIDEMIEILNEMNGLELIYFLTEKEFNEISKMIGKNKLTLTNAFTLLSHIGHCRIEFSVSFSRFCDSLLAKRFENMIETEAMKRERDENLLIDLCKCYILLRREKDSVSIELRLIIIPFLMNVVLRKIKSKEAQREIEIILTALSTMEEKQNAITDLCVNEMVEVIKYHQQHRNLTRLAHQSAWIYLVNHFEPGGILERTCMNELHIAREVAMELEELTKCVDWKKKKAKWEAQKEAWMIKRWINTVKDKFGFLDFELRNVERIELYRWISRTCKLAGKNEREISKDCIKLFESKTAGTNTSIDFLLKSEIVEAVFETLLLSTLDEEEAESCLHFFVTLSDGLREKSDYETVEAKRKAIKRKAFDILEERGFEECITSFKENLYYTRIHWNIMSGETSKFFVFL
ncbi:uncharacterized protein MONOS_7572 [Monocercomonoides exilis]|uniref:uncharacterized protein n=1 Tax=Monocercomonoides exilis TaxID=2049356 RepID=UPI00355AA667|nr:hypothetical protein MONOS_7572 [Monocercomonoides exilis]